MSIEPLLASARDALPTDPKCALDLARHVLGFDPGCAEAHRVAGQACRALGLEMDAERHELDAIDASVHDPVLQKAAEALYENSLHIAEPMLRDRLKAVPTDVAAIRMLAELAGRIGRYADAEALLRRALELAPGFHAARSNLAMVLYRRNQTVEALAELDRLFAVDPANPAYANLRAAAFGRVGDFEEAIALYEGVLQQYPGQPKIWLSYGHALKTVGRQKYAVAAYRRATDLQPALGEAWWSLANLKIVELDAADIAAMEQALAGTALSDEDRYHLEFALGAACHGAGAWARAFGHYGAGNALRKSQLGYGPDQTTKLVDQAIALFTPDFIASRADPGDPAPDPIFILGLPRAGSTLIEQILSSHSMVEGTMELPDIPMLVTEQSQREGGLAGAAADRLRALGRDYIDRTRIQRKEGKPYFIDKLPNNWLHVGFIHLILPSARIIDAPRHPLDCGFSNFRQHFARGQAFSYGLEDVGRYYADYERLMTHFDHVLPGRIHRVFHERLIDNPEREIRALLNSLGLPFEDACLAFHENQRAVRTASSEQVRRPINRDGTGQWRNYDQWLGPLRAALGPALEAYPETAP